mgnify:FL=1
MIQQLLVLEIFRLVLNPVIDIHKEAFANHPDPLSLFPFRKNLHFNAKGYANVAKTIVTSVEKYEQDNSQK